VNCGTCCIALSISSPILGLPNGKPAGVRCVQLTDDYRCRIYDRPGRPPVCAGFQASLENCGASREEAMAILAWLERTTLPVD